MMKPWIGVKCDGCGQTENLVSCGAWICGACKECGVLPFHPNFVEHKLHESPDQGPSGQWAREENQKDLDKIMKAEVSK